MNKELRNYKDTMFRMVFRDRENLLSLYNALNGTHYEDAVELAITECIREGILSDFLKKNRAEAMEVCLYEYDEEKHLKNERQIAYEEGEQAGVKQGIDQGIKQGIKQGIEALILDNLEDGKPEEIIIEKIMRRFDMEESKAKECFEYFAMESADIS